MIVAVSWTELERFMNGGPAFILKSDKHKPFIIAGYASVDIIDKDNEKISLPALREAFERMMSRPSRRNLMLHHGNVQIGELLWEAKDSDNKVWKSAVDDVGLFIVAEVFGDTKTGREVQEQMRANRLLSFSVGGRKIDEIIECDSNKCWREIVKLDLHEVTSCDLGKNPEAKAFILKEMTDKGDNADRTWDREMDNNTYKHIKKMGKTGVPKMDPNEVGEEGKSLKDAIDGLTALIKDLSLELKAAKKKPKEYYYYKKPQKEEFTDAVEYAEALESYASDEADKARKKKKDEEEELVCRKIDEEVEASIVPAGIEDTKKESYKQHMKACMKGGKSLAECAAEWKKKEDEDAEKAKKVKKPEEEEEEEEKAKKNKYYKYPKKEDYASEEEFKQAEMEFNALKAEIIKGLGITPSGEVIKKSVKTPKEVAIGFDVKKIDVKDARSLKEYLKRVESE